MADFFILSKPGCPACTRAKAAIERAGMDYEEKLHDTPELIAEFVEKGFRTFPQVYRGAEHIGGADQTQQYLNGLGNRFDDNDF